MIMMNYYEIKNEKDGNTVINGIKVHRLKSIEHIMEIVNGIENKTYN